MNRQLQIHMLTLCLLVLLAVSCKQDDCGSPAGYSSEMIVFTSPYTLTRSDALRYGSFRSGDKVGVLGFCKAENMGEDYSSSPWNTKKVFCIPEVFYNQQLTYGEAGLWTYQWDGHVDYLHPWYNDPEYTYSFFAYYPYAEIVNNGLGTIHNQNGVSMGTVRISGKEVKGDPTITYTMPFIGTDLSEELDWQLVPDLMLAYKIDHQMNDGPVGLNFRHLLCAFEFKVNNYNLEEVTISSLKVSGKDFYKEVTVKGQQSGYDIGTGRYSGTFDVLSTYNEGFVCPPGEKREGSDEVIPATVSITTDGSVDPEGDPVDLLFIPNEHGKLTADDNESLNLIVTVDGYQKNVSMNLQDATFKAGVRSIFSINIVGNDIYLQVETDGNWNDGGDSDISFE